ncbi:hypothetical protein CCAX7_52510 [Capsulimonas corticalis]|uniref:Uncharacterized protein n=1 Tax=Capsulimonas corticalis TaxID=2219043 RepID=A0A402CP24_9BACT|nr:hypothetical protein [Capsulimonas corticalis]BDI33200.1 hypothetical protein CCAX7_52510 [Capsulimonas corticalis]
MRHKFHLATLAAIAALPFSSPIHAQIPEPPPAAAATPLPAAPRVALSAAVAQASVPKGVLVLATYPERKSLPSAIPPAAGDSLPQIAQAFGLLKMEFGAVTALGPTMMTVFNDAPSGSDIYSGMPPKQVLVLLAATLSQDQWGLLTGKSGIADSDLTTREQHAMWAALWGYHRIDYQVGNTGTEVHKEDLMRARLRLTSTIRMRLYNKADNSQSLTNEDVDQYGPSGMDGLYMWDDGQSDASHGPLASVEAPNTPKPSDLDWGDRRLRAMIETTGVTTVGGLVDRVRAQTGVEIYADQRMEQWPLLLTGDISAKSAADLLRALAFVVAGAYRRVGPAYVLTDDLTGAGARTQVWRDFERDVETLRRKPVSAASGKIHREHGDADLPTDSPLALSAEQIRNFNQPIENLSHLELPFDQLTPSQKAAAKDLAAALVKVQSQPGHPYQADLTQKVVLQDDPVVHIILPNIPKPLELTDFSPTRYDLFRRSDDENMQGFRQMLLRQKAQQDAKGDKDAAAHLKSLLAQVKRSALLAAPRSEKEAAALLDSMATAGFHELWLKTFTEGQEQRDLLKSTIRYAVQKGITVFPVVSLFSWGQSATEDAWDVTILGENSLQSNAHWRARSADDFAMMQQVKHVRDEIGADFPIPDMGYHEMIVSPFSEATRAKLETVVRDLAATPGIGGMVWNDTLPSGYDDIPRTFDNEFYASLGYTTPARVAFLRKWRVDPIDIVAEQTQAHAWPVWMQPNTEGGTDMSAKWRAFLFGANVEFLRKLSHDAQPKSKGARLPIFVQQRRDYEMTDDKNTHWFGSWDSSSAPLPSLVRAQDTPDAAAKIPDPAAQASSQSKESRIFFTPQSPLDCAKFIALLGDTLKEIATGKSSWQGFVLDVTQLPDGEPLARIAAEMAAKSAAPDVKKAGD